jgi:adenylate kinase
MSDMSDVSDMGDVVFIGTRAPRLVVMGRQGAGKGTQAARIAARFGVTWLSTGAVLRGAIEDGTPMGLLAAPFVARGDLVPDDVVLDLVVEWTQRPDVMRSGFVLDGVPRTVAQAVALCGAGVGPFDAVIEIHVPRRVAVDRLVRRGRHDDLPAAIDRRLAAHEREASALRAWCLGTGALVRVDGTGTAEEVWSSIERAVDRRLTTALLRAG